MVKSSDILLSLDSARLEVFKNKSGVCVCYQDAEIQNGSFLIGAYGVGDDFETACNDYLSQIIGKSLVFNAGTSYRREVMVLG